MMSKGKKLFLGAAVSLVLGKILFTEQTQIPSRNPNFAYAAPVQENSFLRPEELAPQLDAIVNSRMAGNSRFGVAIYSLDSKKTIYAKNADQPVTPASVTKLFTCFNALSLLGGDTAAVRTRVYSDAPIEDGVINGNVYIAGQGDPFLSVNDIEMLADLVSKAGVKKITGSVYSDNSFFDNITDRAIYSGDNEVVQPMPPVAALSLNRNTVTVLVSAAASPGVPLRVQTIPRSDAFTVSINAVPVADEIPQQQTSASEEPENEPVPVAQPKKAAAAPVRKKAVATPKRTVRQPVKKAAPRKKAPAKKATTRSKRQAALLEENWEYYAGDYYMAPAPLRIRPRRAARPRGPSIRVQASYDASTGKQHFNVIGSLAPNRTVSYNFNIIKPDVGVAGTLRKRLAGGGITINGGFGVKARPQNAVFLAEFKRPLSDVIVPTNKHSDNFLAEHIFKMIGGNNGGTQNTAQKAWEAEYQNMKNLNITDIDKCVLHDGSGLSRRNLVTVNAVVGLLVHAASQPYGRQFDSSLAISGVDGTLRKRMRGTAAEGNLHGKTGTLRSVSGLAGYVNNRSGERFAYAIISNGPGVGSFKALENEIAVALASSGTPKQ